MADAAMYQDASPRSHCLRVFVAACAGVPTCSSLVSRCVHLVQFLLFLSFYSVFLAFPSPDVAAAYRATDFYRCTSRIAVPQRVSISLAAPSTTLTATRVE